MAERGFGFERAFAEINLDRHNIEALIFRKGPLPSALSENASLAEILRNASGYRIGADP